MKNILLSGFFTLIIASSCSDRDNFGVRLKFAENESKFGFEIDFNDTLSAVSNGLSLYEGKTAFGLKVGLQKIIEKDTIYKIWVDTDHDGVLSDEFPYEVLPDGQTSKILVASTIPGDDRKLPFCVFMRSWKSGYYYTWSSLYHYNGVLSVDGDSIQFKLFDLNTDGIINKLDAMQGTNIVFSLPDTAKYPKGRWCRTTELIAFGEKNYQIDSISPAGDYIHFKVADIPVAKINEQAPDFLFPGISGTTYKKKDFRGQWLLLDFWWTGCPPCIKKFPELTEFYGKHKDHLKILGVCVEKQSRRELAREIIGKYNLDWQHAFVPAEYKYWLSYGAINDNHLFFPLYVLISPDGVIKYAGNAYEGFSKLEDYFTDTR